MGPHAKRDARRRAGDLSEDEDEEDDDLHGVQLGRSSSTKGAHLGGGGSHNSLSTPKDETRRAARALRKGGGAGPDEDRSRARSRSRSRARAGPARDARRAPAPEHQAVAASPAVDPAVMRKIQKDLDRIARKENERERAKRRRGAKDAKDVDRSASRLTGAGVGEAIVHVPLSSVAAGWGPPQGHHADGSGPGMTPHLWGSHSKRGSFASVAYSGGTGSSDEDDAASLASGGSRANLTRHERRRSNEEAFFADVMGRRRRDSASAPPTAPVSGTSGAEVADSLRYMEVMSRYLAARGVHGSLLDELEATVPRVDGDDVAARFESVGVPAMAKTPSELAEAAAAAARKRGFGRTTRDEDEADEDEADEDETLDEAAAEEDAFEDGYAAPPTPRGDALSPLGSVPREPLPLGSVPRGDRDHSELSPAALPFDGRRSNAIQSPTPSPISPSTSFGGSFFVSPEPSEMHTTLAASIEHMRGSGAVPRSDRETAARATGETPEEKSAAFDRERHRRGATPPPGETSTLEESARVAATSAGANFLAALDDATSPDGFLGDAQRASADVLHELEAALGMCEDAVDHAASAAGVDIDPALIAARAAACHSRLSRVLLEEVTVGAGRAAATLRTLTDTLKRTSEAEAAAAAAAEEAAAAAMAEETGEAALMAAAAEHVADVESENTAAALVRAAHAGAWVAQHLSVYMRWAKRASAWAGKPPREPRRGSFPPREEESAPERSWIGDASAAKEAADATYARAIYDVVISWSAYISTSAAAAPRDPDERADDEDDAFWGGREDKKRRHRGGGVGDGAARRSFLRSLWVQAFIAQSCVQGAFSTAHTERLAKNTASDLDFEALMRAVMRIIAVATTVENQLSSAGGEMGADRGNADAGVSGGASASPSPMGSPPRPAKRDAAKGPSEARGGEELTAPQPLRARSPSRINRDRAETVSDPPPSTSAATASMDYIDALWTSVSQVKTLKFERAIKIGRGGFSTVLRATWRGSTVAVKVLDPKKINGDVVDAIKREVTVMTANRHPHIVTVLAASVSLPDASIIMEHCANGSLADVLARARRKPARLCWRVRLVMACDAACGLAYLHSSSNQIAHRDINTQNLLVTEDMRVKIADFGLSRLVRTARGGAERAGENAGQTLGPNKGPGVVNGDAAFEMSAEDRAIMSEGLRNCLFHAPEVIEAGAETGIQGTRADVFSFGCVLWCLATLAPPWEEVQKQHEDLPETLRFYNTMKDVAAKVAEGERLPLPTDANANETETETEPPDAEASGAKLFARGVETHAAGAPKLSEVIDRCFRADPAERPTMTRVLQTLRKMRRDEAQAEFDACPPPEEWRGFAPAAVPHMPALGAAEREPSKGGDGVGAPYELPFGITMGSSATRRLAAAIGVAAAVGFAFGRWGRAGASR